MSHYKVLIYLLLAFVTGLTFSACDDDSVFDGNDNFLVSFALVQDGNSYTGVIGEGKITVTIPDTLTLYNTVAEYTCSEHATISPNPASITEWDQPHAFTVTSYSGKSQTYQYTLQRSIITIEEGINLRTEEDIALFAEKHVSRIEGSLVIGMKDAFGSQDSIYSLAPLASLKEVTGNIKIYPSFGGTSLEGLENLEHVGGIELVYPENNYAERPEFKNLRRIELNSLKIVDSDMKLIADTLDVFNFPNLTAVGRDLFIEGNGIRALNAPKLQTVGREFLLGSARWYGNWPFYCLETVDLPELASVGGNFSIKRTDSLKRCLLPKLNSTVDFNIGSSVLEELEVSNLTEVGRLNLSNMPLSVLNLSNLKIASAMYLQSLTALKSLSIPVKEIEGDVQITNLSSLEKMDMGELERMGSYFQLQSCPKLTDLNLGKLEEISGNLIFSSLDGLRNSDCFHSLKKVGGNFGLTVSSEAPFDFSGFEALTYVGGNFSLSGDGQQTALDAFNNLEHIGTSIQFNGMPNVTSLGGFRSLKSFGNDFFVNFVNFAKLWSLSDFLSKFKDVSLSTMYISQMPELSVLDLTGLKILGLNCSNLTSPLTVKGETLTSVGISMQSSSTLKLEGIEQLASLTVMNSLESTESMSFDGLKTVRGNLYLSLPSKNSNMQYLSFPDLESVGGTMTIAGQGYASANISINMPKLNECAALTFYGMKELNLPDLESVTGQCSISTAFVSGQGLFMMGDGDIKLPNLASVGSLIITTNTYNASQYNSTLTNLDFLSSLRQVTSTANAAVQVNKQSDLTDFSGLKNVVEGLTSAAQWSVSSNAYNPTFEEAKSGKLKQ